MKNSWLDENDVITTNGKPHQFWAGLMPSTFRVKELREKIRTLVIQQLKFDIDQTVVCQVLKSETPGWNNGTIQIKIEVSFVENPPKNIQDSKIDNSQEFDQLRSLDIEITE
jgi:hypothetical protein